MHKTTQVKITPFFKNLQKQEHWTEANKKAKQTTMRHDAFLRQMIH